MSDRYPVVTSRPGGELDPVPAHQFDILTRMGVEAVDKVAGAAAVDVIIDDIVDAVIGYSLRGAPKGPGVELIAQIMAARSVGGLQAVVSLDNPSALNVTTGATPGMVVEADATMTLCLPKTGLRSAVEVGRLDLADISAPPSVTSTYGPAPDFRPRPILELIR